MPPAERPALPHIPALDGVRGIAILLVLLCHSAAILRDIPALQFLGFGWVGVDLFFVLSGYLITGILLGTRTAPNYYRRFYLRRALRIWPLYFVYLAVMAALVAAIHRSPGAAAHSASIFTIQTPWPLYLIFCQNLFWPTLFGFVDYISITWSLCIEEHFYLLWAPTVKRLSIPTLRAILVTVLLASPLLRILAFYLLRTSPFSTFYETVLRFTPLHLDAISAGCLLALTQSARSIRLCTAMFVAGIVLSLFTCDSHTVLFAACYSALALLFTGLVGLVLQGFGASFFSWPALRYTGKISYGLYLINPSVYNLLQSHTLFARLHLMQHLQLAELAATILAFSISFALAALSWHLFESKVLALKSSLAR